MSTEDTLKARIDNEITVCSICLQTFDDPRSLPCLHTFCLRCIFQYWETRPIGLPIPCPQCRRVFSLPSGGVSNLPHNFTIENLIQASRSHEYCGEHDDQILKKFCTECCLQICPLCEVLSHSNHKCISLSNAREHLVRRIDEEVGKVSGTEVRTTKEKERLENMTDIFRNKTLKIIDDIKSTGEEMKQLIDQHINTLISEVKAVQLETLEKLKSINRPLIAAIRKVEQFKEHARHAKSHEKIKDIVSGFKTLSETARELPECEMPPSTFQPPEMFFVRNSNLENVLGSSRVGKFIVNKSTVKRKHEEITPEAVASQNIFPVSDMVGELPVGTSVCGVATFGNELFVLRSKSNDQLEASIEVYDSTSYILVRRLSAPVLKGLADMVACEYHGCLYISDSALKCVHRSDVKSRITVWCVGDEPCGLSVTADHNVLVTCQLSRKLKEFTTDGCLMKEVNLPTSMDSPWHAIKLTSAHNYAACHGAIGDRVHRVCVLDRNRNIAHSYGNQRGYGVPSVLDVPCRLVTDKDGYIFVADTNNRRILKLTPTLQFVRDVVTPGQLAEVPWRMCLDVQRRRLHVAENKCRDGNWISGRVIAFSV